MGFIEHKIIKAEIGTQTIAKDTMKAIKLAGINMDRFKSHATKMTAALKAINKGAS